MKILASLLILSPLSLMAQTAESEDSPWITPSDDMIWTAAGYSMDDIIAMADLDGDPTVISAEEQAMIALLSQVLGAQPLSN